jgi:hypothetical protein
MEPERERNPSTNAAERVGKPLVKRLPSPRTRARDIHALFTDIQMPGFMGGLRLALDLPHQ